MRHTPKNLFLLGCRASGKTSFLTGLYLISMRNGASPFKLIPSNDETNKEFSSLKEYADRQMWPPATSTLSSLEFELNYNDYTFDLSVLDYPGEDLKKAMESMSSENYEQLIQHIKSTDCLMILVDPTQDLFSDLENDKKLVNQRQDALLTAIGLLMKHRRGENSTMPSVYLVVTKSDLYSDIDQLVVENTNIIDGLRKYSRSKAKIIPLSAIGSTEAGQYPEHPSPQGYEKLFKELTQDLYLERLKKSKPVHWFLGGVTALIIITLAIALYNTQEIRKLVIFVTNAPLEGLVSLDSPLSDDVQDALDDRMKRELESIKKQVAECRTDDDFQRCRENLNKLGQIKHVTIHTEITGLQALHSRAYAKAIYIQIEQARKVGNPVKTEQLALRYLKDNPSGEDAEAVIIILDQISNEKKKQLIRNIREIKIDDTRSLDRKSREIGHYLKAYPSDSRKKEVDLAVALAQHLAVAHEVQLRFNKISFGGDARDIKAELHSGSTKMVLFNSEVGKEPENTTFNLDGTKTVQPKNYNLNKIIITDLDLVDEELATVKLYLLKDLQSFHGNYFYPTSTGDPVFKEERKKLKLEIQLKLKDANGKWQAVSEKQVRAYGKYIYPGTAWK